MSEKIHIKCSNCGWEYLVSKEYIGGEAKCKKCDFVFKIELPPIAQIIEPPNIPPVPGKKSVTARSETQPPKSIPAPPPIPTDVNKPTVKKDETAAIPHDTPQKNLLWIFVPAALFIIAACLAPVIVNYVADHWYTPTKTMSQENYKKFGGPASAMFISLLGLFWASRKARQAQKPSLSKLFRIAAWILLVIDAIPLLAFAVGGIFIPFYKYIPWRIVIWSIAILGLIVSLLHIKKHGISFRREMTILTPEEAQILAPVKGALNKSFLSSVILAIIIAFLAIWILRGVIGLWFWVLSPLVAYCAFLFLFGWRALGFVRKLQPRFDSERLIELYQATIGTAIRGRIAENEISQYQLDMKYLNPETPGSVAGIVLGNKFWAIILGPMIIGGNTLIWMLKQPRFPNTSAPLYTGIVMLLIPLLGILPEVMPSSEEKAADINLQGLRYVQKNEQDKAIECFTKAIELNPKFHLPYMNRGESYNYKKEYKLAIADFDKAIDLNSKCFQAYYGRGYAYHYLNNQENAITNFTKAIDLNPKSGKSYKFRGRSYYYHREYDKAISDLTKALNMNFNDDQSFKYRALAYRAKNQNDKALSDLNRAIKINSKNYAHFKERGLVLAMEGKYEKALDDMNITIKLNPRCDEAFNIRAIIYRKKEEFQRSLSDHNQSISLNQTSFHYSFTRGITHLCIGNWQNAQNDFTKAAQIDPSSARAQVWQYVSRERRGQNGSAELRTFSKTIKDKDWSQIGRLLLNEIKPDDFFAAFLPNPSNVETEKQKDKQTKANLFVAQYYMIHKNPESAKAYFQKCLDLQTRNLDAYDVAKAELSRIK